MERAGQPARLTSWALTMCKPAASSLPTAADLPDSSGNPEPSEMNGHLLVDIFTLAFVVVAVVLFLVIKTWLRRKAAAAKSAAESAAAEAGRPVRQDGGHPDGQRPLQHRRDPQQGVQGTLLSPEPPRLHGAEQARAGQL